jgi:predicted transcriptional regulator
LLIDYLAREAVAGHSCLGLSLSLCSCAVGVSEILDEIKSLPAEQRWQILERTREMLGAEIPDSFKRGMEEIARGEVIELDEALNELDRQE